VSSSETAATLYVIATSTADTSKSGSTTVTITRSSGGNQNDQGQNQNNQGQNQNSQGQNQTGVPSVTAPTVTGVTVSPSARSTKTNSTVQFSARVNGTNNPKTDVTWKVSSNAAGTGTVAPGTNVNASGLLKVAPNEWSPTLYVIATSVADPSKSATAAVTVTNVNENQGSNQGKAQSQ
jgi:hypothetical protein